MKKYSFIKCIIVSIIILLFGFSILPNIAGDKLIEINNHNSLYSQKLDNGSLLFRYIRFYVFGSIYDLTINNNTGHYRFSSNNIRVLGILFNFELPGLEILYAHYFNMHFDFQDVQFRGIIKPTFICGYFIIIEQY